MSKSAEKLSVIVFSVLLYLPSIAFVSVEFYLLAIGFSLYFNWTFIVDFIKGLSKGKIRSTTFFLLLIFAVCTFVLRIIDYDNWDGISDIYSFGYLFLFTFLVARTIQLLPKVLNYLVLAVLAEAIFSYVEYFLGISSFFKNLPTYREFESYDLLYFTRVFGLSVNSSIFSLKLLVGFILVGVTDWNERQKLFAKIILIVGSILAFGRITLIGLLLYLLISFFKDTLRFKNYGNYKGLLKNHLPLILVIVFFSINPYWTKKQFTRDNIEIKTNRGVNDKSNQFALIEDESNYLSSEITDSTRVLVRMDMSGRNEIWSAYLDFIKDNFWFGGYGRKVVFGKYHAHNSILELISSFGIILTCFLLGIFFFSINRENFVYLIVFGFLALGQYAIFWGISIIDVVFYYFIFFFSKSKLREK